MVPNTKYAEIRRSQTEFPCRTVPRTPALATSEIWVKIKTNILTWLLVLTASNPACYNFIVSLFPRTPPYFYSCVFLLPRIICSPYFNFPVLLLLRIIFTPECYYCRVWNSSIFLTKFRPSNNLYDSRTANVRTRGQKYSQLLSHSR